MVRWCASLALALSSGAAPAFDAGGFESGMSREDVIRLAAARYDQVGNAREFLLAAGPRDADGPESIQFWFCKDRLILVNAKPRVDLSVRNILALANEEITVRGQPLRIETRALMHGGLGESRELTFIWKTSPDYFNVTFEYLENHPGHVSHAWFAENACMRPHWMHGIEGGSDEARVAVPAAGG